MAIYTKYTVQDRVTLDKAAFQMIDEQLAVVTSIETTLPDPIFRDTVNPDDYWVLFISDGQIAWEPSSAHYNDIVVLVDSVTGDQWKLAISDGQLNWTRTIYFNHFTVFESLITKETLSESLISKEAILQSKMDPA